ncbi:extracellular trypsin protease [Boeremia exigua]|uniref:extracellular trypsin protease n=1 Tax=Boeremia exigua TaxID=749465 RepID=UPI001E8CF6F6|nr:extracellular trypsin protease [Boeremia exigua]KAH6614326.1 extracellular trypsin protease [Boeremia exigua]
MIASIILVALIVPVMVCMTLDPPPRKGILRIIGGVAAEKGQLPYVVSLQIQRNPGHFCTGTLLDATTVLTAAHCIVGAKQAGYDASKIVVQAGSLSRSSGGVVAKVSYAVIPPAYTTATYAGDVGVLKLRSPIAAGPGIGFAELARKGSDPTAGTMVTAAGWGNSYSGDDDGTEDLRTVDVPVVSRKECNALYKAQGQEGQEFPIVTKDMICAGYIDDYENGKDSCHGDSGGPLVDKETGLVVGVVSWGPEGCGTDGFVGVYAGVGQLRTFIDRYRN